MVQLFQPKPQPFPEPNQVVFVPKPTEDLYFESATGCTFTNLTVEREWWRIIHQFESCAEFHEENESFVSMCTNVRELIAIKRQPRPMSCGHIVRQKHHENTMNM